MVSKNYETKNKSNDYIIYIYRRKWINILLAEARKGIRSWTSRRLLTADVLCILRGIFSHFQYRSWRCSRRNAHLRCFYVIRLYLSKVLTTVRCGRRGWSFSHEIKLYNITKIKLFFQFSLRTSLIADNAKYTIQLYILSEHVVIVNNKAIISFTPTVQFFINIE